MGHLLDLPFRLTPRFFFDLGAAGLAAFVLAIAAGCGSDAEPGRGSMDTATPVIRDNGQQTEAPAASTPTGIRRSTTTATSAPVAALSRKGQLGARPGATALPTGTAQPGLQPLGIVNDRDTLIYVPAGYSPDEPTPLVVLLHGAGGDAQGGISLLRGLADEANLILLAPSSRGPTWDMLVGEYGPDVELIDRALAQAFSRYSIDPSHVAVGGFSDGASYALSVGITNGGLFTHIISFSPGFMAPTRREGKPRIFNSHGTRDAVLPIDRCSRRIVPQLKLEGYDVLYREFEGPHTVPHEIAREAVTWFTAGR